MARASGRSPALADVLLYTPGDALTTLEHMRDVVDQALRDPYVIDRANRIIARAPARDWSTQIDLIRQYLEHGFLFVDNPVGLQRVLPPALLLHRMQDAGSAQGACDDAATLVATLGMANGLPARFVAYAFCETHGAVPPDPADIPFTHVIGELFDGTHWVMLDVTRPKDMFRLPCVARTLALEL